MNIYVHGGKDVDLAASILSKLLITGEYMLVETQEHNPKSDPRTTTCHSM